MRQKEAAGGGLDGLLGVLTRIATSLERLVAVGWCPPAAPRVAAGPLALAPEQKRALELFRQAGRPLGRREVMAGLGKPGPATSMVLQRLLKAGWLRREGRNRYVLHGPWPGDIGAPDPC